MKDLSFHKKIQGFIIFTLVFITILLSFSEVRAALSLLSGRTYDEAHDAGYIDWSGSVGYANILHRDSICPITCVDTVSQISNGSQISGAFDRDVGSFNALVAMVPGQGYGTLTLTTCGVTNSANLNAGTGSTPGYVKVFVSGVPSTCRTWSASASGGTVYLAAVDVTYSVPALLPPTISGSLPCSVPGANSWCVSGLSLDLTASDPQGYSLIISGDINSTTFACTAGLTSCSVPISTEGSATANFRATSSVALFSSDSVVYKLDGTAPQLTGTTSGASGNPGWFISNVDFSLSTTDAVSGVALVETLIDGGAWTAYTAPITLTDGLHGVQSRATDYAGNVAPIVSQTINIDTLTPLITPTVSGVVGLNSWYVSSVQVSAVASDAGSGLATFEADVDSSGWVAYTAPIILTDGVHSVQFRATDQAGNLTTSPAQTIQVDTLTPTLSLPITGTAGLNGWYVSNTQVAVTAGDAGSGIFSTEALQDGALYTPYTVPLSFAEGQHTYQVRTTDMAGNVTETAVLTMNVDTIFPLVTLTPSITLGDAALYTLMDNGSQLAYLNGAISDSGGLFTPLAWSNGLIGSVLTDQFVWDGKFAGGINAPPGTYQATLKIMDAAGNETTAVCDITINVLSFIEPVPPFHPPSVAVYHPIIPTATPAVVFGGNISVPSSEPSTVTAPPTGGTPITGVIASMQSWTQTTPSATLPPLTTSTILWGAASAAAVGFFLIDAQKRKEEEEAKLAEAQRLIDEREAQARVVLDALHDKERESLVILQAEYERAEAEREAEEQRAREEKLAARAAAAAQKLAQQAWSNAQAALAAVPAAVTKVANTVAAKVQPIKKATTVTPVKVATPVASKTQKTATPVVVKAPPKMVAPVVTKPPATGLWGSITSAVSKVTTSVASTVKKVVTPVVNTVKKVVTPVVNTVKKVVAPVVNTVKKVVTPVVNTMKAVVTPIANAVTSTVKKVVTPVVNTVKKVVTPVASAITSAVNKVVAPIVNTVKDTGALKVLAAPALDDDPPWWEQVKKNVATFVEKWTTPSQSANLFEPPKWLDTVSPLIKWPVEYLDSIADSSITAPSDSKIVNVFKNVSSYIRGATTQFTDDMTLGLFSWFTGLQSENGDQFFQEGRQIGHFISTVESVIEMAAGLALIVDGAFKFFGSAGVQFVCMATAGPGGTVCGIVTGPMAAVGATEMVGGLALGGHGLGVFLNNASNPLQIRGEGGSSGLIGEPVPGKDNTKYRKTKTLPGPNRDYEVRVTGKFDPELAIELYDDVEFDWYEGGTLIDAKNAGETRSMYDVSQMDSFTQNVKIKRVLDQATRQLDALPGTGFDQIEWRVADPDVANSLERLFEKEGIPIIVEYYP